MVQSLKTITQAMERPGAPGRPRRPGLLLYSIIFLFLLCALKEGKRRPICREKGGGGSNNNDVHSFPSSTAVWIL